jgi:hypothetical protein
MQEITMPATLMFGSVGPVVAQLQEGLNKLASQLAKLTPDGQFGSKTRSRVVEFQQSNKLAPDGVVGPMTWEMLLKLLQQVAQGGVPTVPGMPTSSFDALRPLVLTIANQHLGAVDFSQRINGRPRGLEFLIEMFRFAADVQLTEANFKKGGSGDWHWKPWIGLTSQEKSWCGIFAVYCYRKAGAPVRWDIGRGGPVGPIQMSSWSPQFVANMKKADIGAVATQNHHFLIEDIGTGAAPSLTTIDGNTDWGRIQRRTVHKVGRDNFNYYRFLN